MITASRSMERHRVSRVVKACSSWMPPSWKLTGSKIIESPRGLGSASISCGRASPPIDINALCSDKGGRASSALMPKAKHSKEKARSRLLQSVTKGRSAEAGAGVPDSPESRTEKSSDAGSKSMEKIRPREVSGSGAMVTFFFS